jgi:hypothetical protein
MMYVCITAPSVLATFPTGKEFASLQKLCGKKTISSAHTVSAAKSVMFAALRI